MRFNKKNFTVQTYYPDDGIIHPEFNRLSHAQAPDGRLYFGGLGGVISFHPKDFVNKQPDDTPLRIIAFEKLDGRNGENYDFTEALMADRKITLEPHETSFRLDFTLVNFEKPEQNQYAYRIDGINADWQFIRENFLRINGLPYGKYTLHIKGQNISKGWSQDELVIPIEVKRPFYLQWWFFAIMFLLLAGAVFIFIKMRTRTLRADKARLEAEVNRRTATIRQQAEELKQLDEMKTRFFHNVAHELRTPLTLIATPITHHLRQLEPDNKWSGFLASIQRNVQHLMRLVESILDLSKFDAQQLELQEEPTNFGKLIQRIFYTYQSYADLHQVDYQLDYRANPKLPLLLDTPKFEKILHNLIFNALKFTKAEDSVTLRVREFDREVQIEVIDTGKGIAPDDLERIFDRYYQVEASEDTLRGGAGIGLSIAQEYAALMGGKLTATSTPGEGSTFKLVIPKREAPGASATDEPSSIGDESEQPVALAANEKNRDRYHILLVEDNVEMQDLLRQIIEPHHDVSQAPNGLAALEKLRNHRVDGIITDIMMPQMDGFELVKRLKAHKKWQSLPVIVLTARANDMDKLEALRIGVDDYLYKPFSAEELVVRIENLIANRINRLRMGAPMPENGSQAADQHWLQIVEKCALSLLDERSDFKISDLAHRVHLSERHLRRKIQEASGMTASDYLREIRLQRARQLLESPARKSVAEIANAVGFASAGYFSKLFFERFGRKPSEYLQ
jgi:signal transduction histidine kinase/DNA-binding response OmpR family regulator